MSYNFDGDLFHRRQDIRRDLDYWENLKQPADIRAKETETMHKKINQAVRTNAGLSKYQSYIEQFIMIRKNMKKIHYLEKEKDFMKMRMITRQQKNSKVNLMITKVMVI